MKIQKRFTSKNPQSKFEGLWIPKKDLFNQELSFLQSGLLSSIKYLQKISHVKLCYATNSYFSEIFKVTEKAISNNIRFLITEGYIEVVKFNGRVRFLKTTDKKPNQHGTNFHADGKKGQTDNTVYNKLISNEISNGFFQKPSIIPNNKIKKKRRLIKLPDPKIKFIIDYWNNIGKPFSKIIKKEPVKKLLIPLLKKNDYRTICEVFDKAYKYMTDPYFFFASKKTYRCVEFFKPNSYSYIGKWIDGNKMNNWFDIFFKKSHRWLEQNVLRLPKDTIGYNEDFYNEICRILSIAPQDRDDQLAIKRTCIRISDWLGVNNTDTLQWPVLNDFEYFIRDNYPDTRKIQPYWFSGRAFWNKQFADYLVQTGRFSHISEIKRI